MALSTHVASPRGGQPPQWRIGPATFGSRRTADRRGFGTLRGSHHPAASSFSKRSHSEKCPASTSRCHHGLLAARCLLHPLPGHVMVVTPGRPGGDGPLADPAYVLLGVDGPVYVQDRERASLPRRRIAG